MMFRFHATLKINMFPYSSSNTIISYPSKEALLNSPYALLCFGRPESVSYALLSVC